MPSSRSATQLALILPLKARLELTDAERDELVRAYAASSTTINSSCRRGFGGCGRSSTSWSPRRQRPSRSRAEAAGRAEPGVEPATAALDPRHFRSLLLPLGDADALQDAACECEFGCECCG